MAITKLGTPENKLYFTTRNIPVTTAFRVLPEPCTPGKEEGQNCDFKTFHAKIEIHY